MITYEDLLGRFAKQAEDRFGAGGVLPSQAEVNPAQGIPSHDAKEKADLPDEKSQKLTFEDGKVKKGPEEPKVNKNVFMTRTKGSTIKQAGFWGKSREEKIEEALEFARKERKKGKKGYYMTEEEAKAGKYLPGHGRKSAKKGVVKKAEEAFLAGFYGETDEDTDLHGAFMRGLLDEMEKDASISRETFPGKKIPRGRIKRTLARIVSPTVAGRANAATTLRLARKVYKKLGLPHDTAHISRELMKGKTHKRHSKINFAVSRLAAAGLLGGGAVLGAKALRKKKKKKGVVKKAMEKGD